ncbi:hypothetical protein [Actinospongicola halichondriae]|uniref:hypothetical protein n=1 Tax=Actinospongicola halichondriae TaxID=3236844 RepID=UPI003D4970A0
MPSASTVSQRPPTARVRQEPIDLLAIALAAVLPVLLVLSGALADSPRVDVAFENPTPYVYDVSVRATGSDQALELGTLSPASTRSITSVIDQGSAWSITFRFAGIEAGTMEVERTDIEGGAIAVPEEMAQALEREGITPPPP